MPISPLCAQALAVQVPVDQGPIVLVQEALLPENQAQVALVPAVQVQVQIQVIVAQARQLHLQQLKLHLLKLKFFFKFYLQPVVSNK